MGWWIGLGVLILLAGLLGAACVRAALLKNPSALKTLLGSPEAKQLLTLLNAQHNTGLKAAAQQAKAGDTAALMAMVNDVMNRPEGAQLMAQLQAKLPDQDKKR